MPYIIIENNGSINPEMFNTRRDAEYHRVYNHIEGRVMFHNPRNTQPRQRQQQISSLPPREQKPFSIIPKAEPYRPFRQPLFNPKTSKKLYGDEYD